MARCTFSYQKADGSISERTVSGWSLSQTPDSVVAYCELRREERTFDINRMQMVVDLPSGNRITDLPRYFGLVQRQNFDQLIEGALPAIKALKFFTGTTRGFREREIKRLVQFMDEIPGVTEIERSIKECWIKGLWCGDFYAYLRGDLREYQTLLSSIPSDMIGRCQKYALWIASGSGRKELDPHWAKRVRSEFAPAPVVVVPKFDDGR